MKRLGTKTVRVIIANTPEELKSELTSKIRQIIADKLAFTAPSITATIQEGGSLYQAQFAYEQFGEWKGTILRKKLNSDGTVEHETTEPNAHGNWSAAVKVRGQSRAGDAKDERHLWSAIPGASYFGNWDNFDVKNSSIMQLIYLICLDIRFLITIIHHPIVQQEIQAKNMLAQMAMLMTSKD